MQNAIVLRLQLQLRGTKHQCFEKIKLSCEATVEDMTLKLSCEASFNFQKLKMWQRSFHARRPSIPNSWTCDNEAFLRCFLQIPGVDEVKTTLSCEASFKFQEWTHLFNAAVPMHKVSQHMQNTIAQHQERIENVTWNHQFHCARSSRTFPR